MHQVARLESLPIGVGVVFESHGLAVGQAEVGFQDVLFGATPTPPLIIFAQTFPQGCLSKPLQVNVKRRVHAQPLFVDCFRPILLFQELADFFHEVGRHGVVPFLDVQAEGGALRRAELRLRYLPVLEDGQQHLIAAPTGGVGMG